MRTVLRHARHRTDTAAGRLESLSPLAVLSRELQSDAARGRQPRGSRGRRAFARRSDTNAIRPRTGDESRGTGEGFDVELAGQGRGDTKKEPLQQSTLNPNSPTAPTPTLSREDREQGLSMANLFQDLTDVYEAMIDWPKRLAREEPFYRRWFERCGARSVLDVACGTGHHGAMFHRWGLRVEGADLSAAHDRTRQSEFRRA